jgi:microcompartment protein CcmL/EutN
MASPSATENAVTGPALALLEVGDLPSGFVALDAVAKEATVTVIAAGTLQHGHYLIAFAGEVEAVELSFATGLRRAGGTLVDAVLLPNAEPRILPALRDGTVCFRGQGGGDPHAPPPGDALGIVQTSSSPTLIRAVDAALKGALVELVELRLAEGLAGRALGTLWGSQHDVEAALELCAGAFARGRPQGCSTAIVANADPEVGRALRSGTRFFKEHRG